MSIRYHFAYGPKTAEAQRKIWSEEIQTSLQRTEFGSGIFIRSIQALSGTRAGRLSFLDIRRASRDGTCNTRFSEVTFNPGYIAGFGFLLTEITRLRWLIILFRKKNIPDNNLEMLFLSLADLAFCVNGIFSIDKYARLVRPMMYYMALTTVGFEE